MTKIYDCVMAHSEIDMLELRMHTLDAVVDHFVVVEAGMTHTGNPKAAVIGDALQTERFAPFAAKTLYYYIETLEGSDDWARERYNRQLIGRAAAYFAQPEDWVIVADVDEIPTPEAVLQVAASDAQAAALELAMYYYSFHYRLNEGWGIGMCRWSVQQDAHKIRTCQFPVPHITVPDAGIHASYFMKPEQVAVKLDAFMHARDIARGTSRDPVWIEAQMKAGKDLFGRSIPIEYIAHPVLLAHVEANREQYTALGWLES